MLKRHPIELIINEPNLSQKILKIPRKRWLTYTHTCYLNTNVIGSVTFPTDEPSSPSSTSLLMVDGWLVGLS